jgi:hypothetical protein
MQFDIPKNFGLGLFARRLVQYGAGRYLEDEGDEGLRKIPITLFWWPALRASLMPFLPQATAFVSRAAAQQLSACNIMKSQIGVPGEATIP